MRPGRVLIVFALLLVAVGVVLPAVAGCGPSMREKTLSTTLAATTVSQDAFLRWDSEHQHGIVMGATSLEDGKAKLAEYRKKQARVQLAFVTVYRALAVASIESKDATSIANLLAVVKILHDELKDITGGKVP